MNIIDDLIISLLIILVLAPIAVIVEIITFPSKNRIYIQKELGKNLANIVRML